MTVDNDQHKQVGEALDHNAGLLYAFRLDAKGGGREADRAEVDRDPLGSKIKGDLWIHLDRTAPDTDRWLIDTARVPEQAVEAMLAEDPRPKFVHFAADETHPEGFVLILRGVNLNPNADPENMVAVRLWVDANRVISLRKRRLMAEDVLSAALRAGKGPLNSADLITHLTNAMMDRIDAVVDELEGELDDAEERLEEAALQGVRVQIGEIRRSGVRLKRYLAPQRDIMLRAAAEWPGWINKRDRLRLRARAERMARVVEDIDELITRAGFAHDELHARLAERMNRSNVGLTVVATIFLPMGLVASMWGMNTEQLPFAEHPNGFWIVNALIALTGVGLALFAWRMSRIS
jgi:zinc transporter